jgi:iron complex transport system ATP-binding protein
VAASEGCIAVVVTHELNLAAELADYVLLLEAGRCLRQGTAEEVFDAELLSRVFRARVLVDRNPTSGRPRVTWSGC